MSKKNGGKGSDDGFDYGEQPELPFGTDPHFLHRRDTHDTSVEAAYSIDTKKYERAVLVVIETYDARGCISDEVRGNFPKDTPYSTITARYISLEDAGYMRRMGDKRKGESNRYQKVMRITPLGRTALSMPIQEKPKRKTRKPANPPDGTAPDHPTPG